eukprot:gene28422-35224_t
MRVRLGGALCIAVIATLLQVAYAEEVNCSANNYTCDFLLVSGSGSGPEGDDGQGFFDGVYAYDESKDYFVMDTVWVNDTAKTCYLSVYDSGTAKYWVFGTAEPSSPIDYATTYGFADYEYESPSCSWSCKRKKDNGECNGECNNPDCDFDGGDCCKGSGGRASSSYPLQGPVKFGTANCEGGYLAYTLASLQDLGYRSEACYPYQYSGNSRNHFSSSGTKWTSCSTVYSKRSSSCSSQNYKVMTDEPKKWGTINLDGTDATFNKVKALLREVGSGPLSFSVYENFMDWDFKYGPAKNPYGNSGSDFNSAKSGGHAVVIVGYGEYKDRSGNKRRYFTVENSWGNKDNDDNGHFYMVADRDMKSTPFNGRLTFLGEELQTALKSAPGLHETCIKAVHRVCFKAPERATQGYTK